MQHNAKSNFSFRDVHYLYKFAFLYWKNTSTGFVILGRNIIVHLNDNFKKYTCFIWYTAYIIIYTEEMSILVRL